MNCARPSNPLWKRRLKQSPDERAVRAPRRGLSLLLVDFLNPLDFTRDAAFIRRAIRAAGSAAWLKARLHRQRVPMIYANDHWGNWTQSLPALVQEPKRKRQGRQSAGKSAAPSPRDYTILKPRHSAFYGTPLLFQLQELREITGDRPHRRDICVSRSRPQVRAPAKLVGHTPRSEQRISILHLGCLRRSTRV